MMDDWLHRAPTALRGKRIFRLGLAASYGIDEDGVRAAMDRGVNLFLWTMRSGGLGNPLREALKGRRDSVAVVGYAQLGWFGWGVRRGAEKLLRELGTDHLDVYLLSWLGVGSAWTSATERELVHLRESGKVRALGVSIHDRPRAGGLAESSPLDLLMIRYNAAHPGAERDIFPHVRESKPSILAYTATAWRRLLKQPKGWDRPAMTAGDCYRFQLSSPHVDLALTGPKSRAEVEANLDALAKGPLTADEQAWMREFGRAVHG
ncbi:aldo/keto reductase [Sorangium sp. So ce327]|jgi:aryl-alcohol dehydrogenase-like predicted oxidoreductase|uniref:aldo/keto reductase n=1 Tax=unclassified Sorangium TaxID=2621164 RepID=UPI003F5DFDAD